MAGSIDVPAHAQQLLRTHINLLGAVPRAEIHQQFAWADIFLLPSICEGSATACYEALSFGLPVITTANTGSVVRDGVDGFIVPIRNAEAISERIERLARDRELLAAMSKNALERASQHTVEEYGERLLCALAGGRTSAEGEAYGGICVGRSGSSV
jgi:glycosyltransferase involved in cell wall biosynthesis